MIYSLTLVELEEETGLKKKALQCLTSTEKKNLISVIFGL